MMAVIRELLDVLCASIWQGAGIAFIVAVILIVTGRRLNAATRCVILQGAVVAIAIVPLATTLPNVLTQTSLLHVFSSPNGPQGVEQTGGLTGMWPRRIDVMLGDRAVLVLTDAWIVGILACTLRIGAGSLQLARLLRHSSLLADRDGIRILESRDLRVPLAIGFTRPSIIVPAAFAARPGEEFECIVLHEVAHIRRGDAYMNACERAIHAFLFFNPAVSLLLRAVALEREAACDDWAIARSCDLVKYTASLASFALWHSNAGSLDAFTTSGFGGATVARIDRLQDERRNGAVVLSTVPIGGFGLVLLTFALLLHAFMPAIAFASQVLPPGATMASATCHASEISYISGPAPHPTIRVPNGLRTLVRVRVSPLGKALGATIYKSSGSLDFDRAVVDAARNGAYSPQTQTCRPLVRTYMFEATTR